MLTWRDMKRVSALGLLLGAAAPGCLGDVDHPLDDGVAGAGGEMGGAPGTGGGEPSGGTGSYGGTTTGGFGGEDSVGGAGGDPPMYPKDAFVAVWTTNVQTQGEPWPDSS